MIQFVENKIKSNLPLKTFCNDVNVFCFDEIIDNFLPIAEHVCGLLNSNNNGGTIIIGVNRGYFCVGCNYDREKWEYLMVKLSRFMYATIVNMSNCKFKYEIEMIEIVNTKKPRFMSKITVSGKKEEYFLNQDGKISYYKIENGLIVLVPLTEEMILKINSKPFMKIGDYYGVESEKMEFKLSFSSLFMSKDGIEKYISSFGNSGGGKLVIGVNDNGIIEGVKIEENEWDKIQRKILEKQHTVSSVDFLRMIEVKQIKLNKKNYYLVEIDIPANNGNIILVKDKNGFWNKWVRVLSCSVKDDRQILYTQKQYQEMESKLVVSEAMRKKEERNNENMRKFISTLEKKNNDVIIEIEQTKQFQEKYSQNVLQKFTENYYKKCSNFKHINLSIVSMLCIFCFFSGYVMH